MLAGTPKTSPLVCLSPRRFHLNSEFPQSTFHRFSLSTTQARRRRCRVDPATRWLGSLRRGRGWRSEASTDLHRFTTESLEIWKWSDWDTKLWLKTWRIWTIGKHLTGISLIKSNECEWVWWTQMRKRCQWMNNWTVDCDHLRSKNDKLCKRKLGIKVETKVLVNRKLEMRLGGVSPWWHQKKRKRGGF